MEVDIGWRVEVGHRVEGGGGHRVEVDIRRWT